MKQITTRILALSMLLCAISLQAVTAASAQWFPENNSTIEYNLSWNLAYKNGTRYSDTQFIIFNNTVDHAIDVYAKIAETQIHSLKGKLGFINLTDFVEVKLKHEYIESSSTTLERKVTLMAGNRTFKDVVMRICVFRNGSVTALSHVNSTKDNVLKTNFFNAPYRFPDYIDRSMNPGDTFTCPLQSALMTYVLNVQAGVISRSPENIIASWLLEAGSYNYIGGLIANPEGRTLSYSYTFQGVVIAADIAGASCTFSRPASSMLLPEYLYWTICGILAVLVIILGIAAARAKRK